jgi:hypothetical protein
MRKRSKYVQITDIYPKLKNPKKYTGSRPVTMRSSWEIRFVRKFLDTNPHVIEWQSESIIVPYYSITDKKYHKYYTDFYFKVKEENKIKEYLIEIKPENKLVKPKQPSRMTQSYKNRVDEWIKINEKKYAAEEYCKKLRDRGINIEYKILTEKHLFGKK